MEREKERRWRKRWRGRRRRDGEKDGERRRGIRGRGYKPLVTECLIITLDNSNHHTCPASGMEEKMPLLHTSQQACVPCCWHDKYALHQHLFMSGWMVIIKIFTSSYFIITFI